MSSSPDHLMNVLRFVLIRFTHEYLCFHGTVQISLKLLLIQKKYVHTKVLRTFPPCVQVSDSTTMLANIITNGNVYLEQFVLELHTQNKHFFLRFVNS